jgi:GxxExxY protein
MPIQCCFDVKAVSKSDFHEIDFQVMKHVFDIQNEFGRFCHESIYQTELVHRCVADGLTVLPEGQIVVSNESFSKSYFIDALLCQGLIYELKAVDALNGQHESQLLNYLFLSGLQNGKLINFSSASVQHRFVTTNIDYQKRFLFSIDDCALDVSIPNSEKLRSIVLNLLNDWGAFLDINLYRDAIVYFFGGEKQLLGPVDISVDGRVVGHQKMHLLSDGTGLHISSTIRNVGPYRKQLEKILNHTNLEKMQWINFSRDVIYLTTLKK